MTDQFLIVGLFFPDHSGRYKVYGLKAKTFYHVRAKARNMAGLSDPSNIIYLQTNTADEASDFQPDTFDGYKVGRGSHSVGELTGSAVSRHVVSKLTKSSILSAVIAIFYYAMVTL